MQPNELIKYYELQPHPEGGYFKQTYISEGMITAEALPIVFNGERHFSTAIYFLVLKNNFSAFHRLLADELWHFYTGGCLYIHIIHPGGGYELKKLGNNIQQHENFQVLVPAGCWFAAECANGSEFCLAGCTMSPGFNFADFELAKAAELAAQYPQHAELAQRLCRQ